MAKLKDGILGAFIGKIGPVIASRRGDTVYLKSRPDKVRHPNTKKQVAVKTRFGEISKLAKLLKVFLRYAWPVAKGKAAFNAFISANVKSAFIKNGDDFELDYSRLLLSVGELNSLKEVQAERTTEGDLNVSWTYDRTGDNEYGEDQVSLIVVAPDTWQAEHKLNAASRQDEEALLKLSDKLIKGERVHLYASVLTLDREKCSDSMYLGCL